MAKQSVQERAAIVALIRALERGRRWNDVADVVMEHGDAVAVWEALDAEALTADPRRSQIMAEAVRDVEAWDQHGWQFITILDDAYPSRLRDIHQAPPFLFACGTLVSDDKAVAVVGSRAASDEALGLAQEISLGLTEEGLTVISGLARGIDTAAHTAALGAHGRTVAVIGSGIARYYPAENRALQERINREGLVLSQFWPDGPPQRHNFLMRNAVMSGYGRATVVVEAGEQSGARAQARMAVEHGRPVILTDLVLERNTWAQRLEGRPGVHVAKTAHDVISVVRAILHEDQSLDLLMRELVGTAL